MALKLIVVALLALGLTSCNKEEGAAPADGNAASEAAENAGDAAGEAADAATEAAEEATEEKK
jgi:hypothetical protein